MSKESVIIELGRVLNPKSVCFSKWQVDEAVQIPIGQGLVPIALWSSSRHKRANRNYALFSKRLVALLALVLGLSAGLSANASQNVSLAWNPSADSSTTGYLLYAGNSTTNYTSQINVGTNTTVTLSGLTAGATNYFAVSAYNAANIVGTPSAPITYIVPGLLVMSHASGTGNIPTLNFPEAPGHWYEVQASTNLTVWSNIYQSPTATTNAWASFQDPQAGSFRSRFYRLVMH